MRNYLPLSLGDTLETNAARFGDTPAYIYDGRRLTHAGLLARAKRLSSALHKTGVNRQDRVSIFAMNCIEFGEVLAAGQWSGIIIATVNYRLAPSEIAYIIGNSSPRVLIFELQYADIVNGLRAELTSIEKYVCIGGRTEWAQEYESFVATGDKSGSPFRSLEEDIACLIYTSGTTGKPKGCILGHREMREGARAVNAEIRSGPFDRILLVMPLFHIGAIAMGTGIYSRGGTVILHRQFEPGALLDAVHNEGVTVLHLAPTLVQMMLDHPKLQDTNLSKLHTLVYSAAAMPLPLLKRGIEVLGDIFVNLYGQTEVNSSGLLRELHRPNGTERERGWLSSVGHPFPNTLIKIVDDNGLECPNGIPGEIIVKSVAMARGYWNNHAATLETFRDGWCHTGDIGKFDDDGMLYLVDRKKDVVISGGENIYSREVEDAVLQHHTVAECAVIGLPDAKWGEAVCAIVVAKLGCDICEADIIEHVRTLIASFKKPKRVIAVSELPKLPTGKINKVELRKRFAKPG